MHRAYSFLEVKAVNDDLWEIEGIATTPTPDRMQDVVEPLGARFALPMPLLWQHQSDAPIGHVTFAKPTKNGIPFKAKLVHPDTVDSPELKARLQLAWDSIKSKLVRAVSIGFRAISHTVIDATGGWKFTEWEWLELSAVTIPANADCTITTIKSIDTELRAATGKEQIAHFDLSGASLQTPAPRPGKTRAVKAMTPDEIKGRTPMSKTIAEQISAFETTRTSKSAEMDRIMDEASEKGLTLDADQKEIYDTACAEVKEIDEHLVRLRDREKGQIATAKPVIVTDERSGSIARHAGPVVQVKGDNVPKGIRFARMVGAKYLAFRHQANAADVAKQMWPDTPEVEMVLRSAIAAATTTDATNAGPLVVAQNLASEFAELLVPETIIGRIPGLRKVPFNISVPRATQNPTAYWVGQGKIKPLSAMAFDSVSLAFAKIAAIVPMTEELLKFSSPSAEEIFLNGLRDAVAYRMDRDFIDPSKTADDVSPASITNGVTAVTATGTTADALRDDLGTLLARYLAANLGVRGLTLVTTSTMAMQIGLLRNTLGNKEFPDIRVDGGFLEGIPVITSENIVSPTGSPTDGTLIVAINANEVMVADDGGVDIDVSREASLQMESAPDSPETASTVTVNLWQHNMVAFKAERFITWKKRRAEAVQLISGAAYK